MECSYCKLEIDEKIIHEHHVHPRFINNPKGLGRKIYLCPNCHEILHLLILEIVKKCIKEIEQYTYNWLKEGELRGEE